MTSTYRLLSQSLSRVWLDLMVQLLRMARHLQVGSNMGEINRTIKFDIRL